MYREDIILASASPRRREMFEKYGIPFEICPADIEESLPFPMTPEACVMYLSLTKGLRVSELRQGLIIAADTVVVFEGEILGKPADEEEAFRVLSRLRDNTHQVITGVCLIDNRRDPVRKTCLYERSDVTFGSYTDEELSAYVRTPEPYDKAGGYAIQMSFGKYIRRVDGDRNNVIGFPMDRVKKELEA